MGLIEQLLGCSQAQGEELLQANAGLLDAGLLAEMRQYADWLESRGQGNAVGLRQFAAQLVFKVAAQEAMDNVERFLLETLQLVANNNGNLQQIYPVWSQQQGRFNDELLAVMQQIVELFFKGETEQRIFVASILIEFGNLIQQFSSENQPLNLELGIKSYELALQVYTLDAFPEQWAATQNNLAVVCAKRIWGEPVDNIERAINTLHLALQVYTRETFPEDWAMTHNNLANAYANPIWGGTADNIERAIVSYRKALTVYKCKVFTSKCYETARNLGNLYFDRGSWLGAATAYTLAFQSSEILYQASFMLTDRASKLSKNAGLPQRTAYALARVGKYKRTIKMLERSRARALSQTLSRDRADLTQIKITHPSVYTEYQDVTARLCHIESQQRDRLIAANRNHLSFEELRKAGFTLQGRLNKLLPTIRQIPGYEKFLTSPNFEDIVHAVRCNQPLVYLLHTSTGSLALIITINKIDPIWLNNWNDDKQLKTLTTWLGNYKEYNDKENKQTKEEWHKTIDTTTNQLWEPLMAPVIKKLKTMGYDRATLIPTGLLSLLPLHAAWTEDPTKPTGRRYAIDDIHFTYAPNAKSLIAAQKIADRIQPTTILAIDNPTQDLKLSSSEKEIKTAIGTFQNCNIRLSHSDATVKAVKEELTKASIVHFSCHGTANLNDPLNSGLVMSDGHLTLKDIFALNLTEGDQGIRLAILSACETGLPGLENIDEVVSLPIGLLQAGVAGVISSLWSVSDFSTMMLLTRFYDLWRKEGLEPAIALRKAQIWLRDTTNGEKLTYFKTNLHQLPPEVSSFLRNKITDINADRTDRTFSHPFHWAAFSYTGI